MGQGGNITRRDQEGPSLLAEGRASVQDERTASPFSPQTFSSVVGHFSQSVFHFNNSQALTGTSAGKLVVWDAVSPCTPSKELRAKPHNMKATKLVPMQDGLTVLTVFER